MVACPVEKVAVGERRFPHPRTVRGLVRDEEETIGARQRQVAQQHAVHDGECRAVDTDAECEGEDRDRCETRRAAQGAKGVAQVLHRALEPDGSPLLARDLLDHADVAELAPGGERRVARRLSARDMLGLRHGEMRADLLVEIGITARTIEEGESHVSLSAGGVISPAMASDSASHLERSAASCLRPAAVRR